MREGGGGEGGRGEGGGGGQLYVVGRVHARRKGMRGGGPIKLNVCVGKGACEKEEGEKEEGEKEEGEDKFM